MAGRPAPGASTTGLFVGMCVSIVVAVIALVLLVVLWTNQEDLRAETESANELARRYMTSSEASGAYRTWLDKATGNRSVVGLMGQELNQFADIVAGDQTPMQPGAAQLLTEGQLEAVWDKISNDESIPNPDAVVDQPLIVALEALYELYASSHSAKLGAEDAITQLNEQVAALTAEKQQLAEAFDTKAAELGDRVASIESERGAFYDSKAEEFQAIEEKTLARSEEERRQRDQLQVELTKERDKLAKAEQAKQQMQEKLREFQILPRQGGTARTADAEVYLATPGSDTVFVNLGRDDHVILGLRFAVYSSRGTLPSTGTAKAAIEVVDIGDNVSECRIVWNDELNPVIAGDVIANPIYDRNRQLVFKVIGEYDLNYDGLDDPNGKEIIEAIIKDFNGVISDDLTARIDFVIVGARPRQGRLPQQDADAAEVIKKEYEEQLSDYQRVFEDAKALSVPMLTQETFLNFLGRQ